MIDELKSNEQIIKELKEWNEELLSPELESGAVWNWYQISDRIEEILGK